MAKAVFDRETKTLTVFGEASIKAVYALYGGISRSNVLYVVIEDGHHRYSGECVYRLLKSAFGANEQ